MKTIFQVSVEILEKGWVGSDLQIHSAKTFTFEHVNQVGNFLGECEQRGWKVTKTSTMHCYENIGDAIVECLEMEARGWQ